MAAPVTSTAIRPDTPSDRAAPAPSRRFWWWIAALPLGLILLAGVALFFIDGPLRAYVEDELNRRIPVYTFSIGALDLHPLSFAVDIKDVVVRQKKHPEPPIASVAQIQASIQWSALLRGRLVSDQWIDRPVIHLTRPQAAREVEDSPAKKRSWQEALFAMQQVQLNEVRVTHGDVTYRENATAQPIHITDLSVTVDNIRNVRSKPQQYPSDLHVEAVIFDSGRFQLDGQADFFAEPTMAVNADLTLTDIELAQLLPLTAQHQVHLSKGRLSATGHVEHAPTVQVVQLRTLRLQEVTADFIHSAKTEKKVKKTARKVAHTAGRATNHPTLVLKIDHGKIENSEFGLVNRASNPPYRIFITKTDLELENWSNQLSEGTARVTLNGLLMGSGATRITGAFRPETKSPDFDLSVKIINTQAKSLNPLLRAYGGMDVTTGVFSVYSEITVNEGRARGYLKPLFKDVQAYDPEQDQDKGFLEKIFEKTINLASDVLENTPRGEVATKAEVSGPVENPQASTWEVVVTLFQNAFFDAVLPGLEGKGKK